MGLAAASCAQLCQVSALDAAASRGGVTRWSHRAAISEAWAVAVPRWAPAAAKMLLSRLPVDCPTDCYISKLVLEGYLTAVVACPQIAEQRDPYAKGDIKQLRQLERIDALASALGATILETAASSLSSSAMSTRSLKNPSTFLRPRRTAFSSPEARVETSPRRRDARGDGASTRARLRVDAARRHAPHATRDPPGVVAAKHAGAMRDDVN